jgi:hypothetical protein
MTYKHVQLTFGDYLFGVSALALAFILACGIAVAALVWFVSAIIGR